MLNYLIVVGRIVNDPILESNDSKEYVNITLAVPRSFKNNEGEYDTDFVDVTAYGSIAENTCKYCCKGDLVGVKGRISRLNLDKEMNIIAEVEIVNSTKLSFLLSSRKEEKNGRNNL